MFPTSPLPPRTFPIEHISTSQYIHPQAYPQAYTQPLPYPQAYHPVYQEPYHPQYQPQFSPQYQPISYSPSYNYQAKDFPQIKDRYAYKPEILQIPSSFPDPVVSDQKNSYGQQREDVQLILYFFREILNFHSELERCKEDLMNKVGFSLSELFKVFDTNQSGEISYFEMQKTFKKFFDIQLNNDEIKLLILRFNRDNNYQLSYKEFSEIFTPKKRINPKKPKYDFIQKFSTEKSKLSMKLDYYLQVLIERIIKITITAENSYKFIKNKIGEKEINLEELFIYMNGNKSGSVSAEDLQIMFEIYNFEASEEDIDNIIGFFDLNGSGKIGKSEFLEEFARKDV